MDHNCCNGFSSLNGHNGNGCYGYKGHHAIVLIFALMATMTLDQCYCDSLNNYESWYIGDGINNS